MRRGAGSIRQPLAAVVRSIQPKRVRSARNEPARANRVSDDDHSISRTAKSLLDPYQMPEDERQSIARYKANVEKLERIIGEGKNSNDQIWRNTCEWLTKRNILYVLSPTDEVHEKLGKRKYLGIDRPLRLGEKLAEKEGDYGGTIMLPMDNAKGFDLPAAGRLIIVDPVSDSDEKIKWILKHEVQHAVTDIPSETTEKEQYRYEFVADWVAGAYSHESERPGSATQKEPFELFDGNMASGFGNARQLAIFADLYRRHPDFRQAWNDRAFQQFVRASTGPQGPNLINSVRIDDLYVALTRPRPDFHAAHDALHRLKDEDKKAIRSQEAVWREVLKKHPDETSFIASELFPQLRLP